MQQRYYDPVVGRFYSNDPVGFTASNPMMFNRYAYANNNPYKYTDPNGETPAVAISRSFQAGYSVGSKINSGITAALGKPLGVAIYNAVNNESGGEESAAGDGITDRSGQSGTSEEVKGFKDDLDSVSSPQSDNPKVRVLSPGIKVKDVMDKAPGVKGENGRKQTENGNIGTHGSTSTQDASGKNVETLSVKEGNNVRKYRESTD